MARYITGQIRYKDMAQRRHFNAAAKKLGMPLNSFICLACEELARAVEAGATLKREVKLIPAGSIVDAVAVGAE